MFAERPAAEMFVTHLLGIRQELGFLLLAYSVMPDHVHLVIVPSDVRLPKIMQIIKGRFARAYNKLHGQIGKLWQGRYYETVVRDEDALTRRIAYVEENPVVAGIVAEPNEYPFSSAAPGARVDLAAYLEPG